MTNSARSGPAARSVHFPPFRIDFEEQYLYRDEHPVPLRGKTWDVLAYLALHSNRVVTKQELLDAVWPSISVTEVTLSTSISEIRRALGDKARNPKYLATIHGRGFRFTAPEPGSPAPNVEAPAMLPFVGREAEVAALGSWLRASSAGQRIVGFVHGEAGIGKTTLIQRALSERLGTARLATGQCPEATRDLEPFGPILEALCSLASRSDGKRTIDVLAQRAPSWLSQMPSLMDELPRARRHEITRISQALKPAQSIRSLVEALETIASEIPLVLWIEDLHWADAGTLEVIGALARRPHEAALTVIGSHRPTSSSATEPTLLDECRASLSTISAGRDLPLNSLDLTGVVEYLAARCPGIGNGLAPRLYEHTGGNALFLTSAVDALLDARRIVTVDGDWRMSADLEATPLGIPPRLGSLLDDEIRSLPATQRLVLEVASVAGQSFDSLTLAAALEFDLDRVEEACEYLASQHFIQDDSPYELDGSPALSTGHYTFTHALKQNATYAQITASRRGRLHLAIADHLAAGPTSDLRSHSAEIAGHYERGNILQKAIGFLCRAAETATAFGSWDIATTHLNRAESLLQRFILETGVEKNESSLEVDIKRTKASCCFVRLGMGAEESLNAYNEILDLGLRLDSPILQALGLDGVGGYHLGRARYDRVLSCGEELIRLGHRHDHELFRMLGETKQVCAYFYQARFEASAEMDQTARALYARTGPGRGESQVGTDPATVSGAHATVALQSIGRVECASTLSRETLAHARTLDDPFNECFALMYASYYRWFRGDWKSGLLLAYECREMAERFSFGMQWAISDKFVALAFAEMGRPAPPISEPPPNSETDASQAGAPGLLWCVARTQLLNDQPLEAEATAQAGLAVATATGAPFQNAELIAVRAAAQLSLPDNPNHSIELYQRAVETSRKQGTPWVELRILVDWLSRMPGEPTAEQSLTPLVERFRDFDSPLVEQATSLIPRLATKSEREVSK